MTTANTFLNYSTVFYDKWNGHAIFGWDSNNPRIYNNFAASFASSLYDKGAICSSNYFNFDSLFVDNLGRFNCIPDLNRQISGTFGNYRSSVLLKNGNIFIGPGSNTNALIFDTTTYTLSTPSGSYFGTDGFSSTVLLKDGRVYNVPNQSSYSVIYNPFNNTVFTPSYTFAAPFNSFVKGILLLDGRVLHCPRLNDRLLIYNPFTNAYSTPSVTFPTPHPFINSQLLPTGEVIFFSNNTTIHNYFLIYDPINDTLTTPNISLPPGQNYRTSFFSPLEGGNLFILSSSASNMRIYDYINKRFRTPNFPIDPSFIGNIFKIATIPGIFTNIGISEDANNIIFQVSHPIIKSNIIEYNSSNLSFTKVPLEFLLSVKVTDKNQLIIITNSRILSFFFNSYNLKSNIHILTSPFLNTD
ncbi:MAG: hypothetical protein NZZ41_00530 [Candidatus Dojkabacteria bacterium]|nr:hypothetical protein [Candidatus Dojkabacteria bacterium]